jgi:hypothetical protein
MGKTKSQEEKWVDISVLKPFPKNPNRHSSAQVDVLSRSIERYGQYYPIITDEKYMVLAGHAKKEALEQLGHDKALVRVIKGLSEKQKMKLVLEDNKIQGMSYIDFSLSDELLKEIGDLDVLGYSPDYLEVLISDSPTMDNMGVDYSTPMSVRDEHDGERTVKQESTIAAMEEGINKTTFITCPHCGQDITI